MNATELSFVDEAFGLVLSVEAAFHFKTRQRFFKEAWRVLEPGGHLLLSDILVTRATNNIPEANVVTLGEYETQLEKAGFYQPRFVSCRDQTWTAFRREYVQASARAGLHSEAERRADSFRKWDKLFSDYILVCAQKPA
jgi:ubiquinone/menaquinone biosynthesis C-methylase UbiE